MEFLRRFEFVKALARSVLHLELQDHKCTLYTERAKVAYWQREHGKVLQRYEELLGKPKHGGNML